MSRTKIAIIGADSAALHIFNMLYKNDDRYEVVWFLVINGENFCKGKSMLNSSLAGPIYPKGIPFAKYQYFSLKQELEKDKVEKCVLTPICTTSSLYLHLAAQCLAAGATVVTPSLDCTQISPPKALVSYFSDTQFDIELLMKILDVYSQQKPAVVFGANFIGYNITSSCGFKACKKRSDLDSIQQNLPIRIRYICEQLLVKTIPVFFVFDYEAFSNYAATDESFDLIVFNGFNTLPCFFASHLFIYSCDDCTFPEVVQQHPSSVLLQQSDVVLFCQIRSNTIPESITQTASSAKVIGIAVGYSAPNMSTYSGKKCFLIDDAYPVRFCNATRSISEVIAQEQKMIPYPIDHSKDRKPEHPIYMESNEKTWPAYVYPEIESDIFAAHQTINTLYSSNPSPFDLVISTTARPIDLRITGTPECKVVQYKFNLVSKSINEDLLALPPGAFVKRRGK